MELVAGERSRPHSQRPVPGFGPSPSSRGVDLWRRLVLRGQEQGAIACLDTGRLRAPRLGSQLPGGAGGLYRDRHRAEPGLSALRLLGRTGVTGTVFSGVGNVFYFVDDLEAAVEWYSARLQRDPV